MCVSACVHTCVLSHKKTRHGAAVRLRGRQHHAHSSPWQASRVLPVVQRRALGTVLWYTGVLRFPSEHGPWPAAIASLGPGESPRWQAVVVWMQSLAHLFPNLVFTLHWSLHSTHTYSGGETKSVWTASHSEVKQVTHAHQP